MLEKNTSNNGARVVPKITARIDKMLEYGVGKVKAVASVNIGGIFSVHGIKVIDAKNGLFVQMPQTSYEKNGERKYSDVCHAATAEAREAIISAVMDAYEHKREEIECVDEDEELPFNLKM